jgi:hypothetical protein
LVGRHAPGTPENEPTTIELGAYVRGGTVMKLWRFKVD